MEQKVNQVPPKTPQKRFCLNCFFFRWNDPEKVRARCTNEYKKGQIKPLDVCREWTPYFEEEKP